ncbi:MAG: glycosyltransferase family 2 protein [Acetobacteraceae bacterium]
MHCVVEAVADGVVTGWAFDPAHRGSPPVFYAIVDGQQVGEVICNGDRSDLTELGAAGQTAGFTFVIPRELLDGATRRLEFRDAYRRHLRMHVEGRPASSCDFSHVWRPQVKGFVDGPRGGAFEGWLLQTDPETGKLQGGCMIRVTCNEMTVGHVRANRYRGDVAKILASDPNCGFQFIPPPSVRRGYPQQFRFYFMPGDIELDNSPFTTSFVEDQGEAALLELSESVDRLHVELTRIRRKLRELLPQPSFTTATYDAWFRLYEPALEQHVVATRPAPGALAEPLVSIVCPVYRPRLADFRAAIQSVIAQTYTNWQLVIVDDGSKDAALTAEIAAFAAADPRIEAYPQAKNGGISAATNAALRRARGAWVAFFDHDDLLTTPAIECMVRAAAASGARLLYSDEDKVDAAGNFSEPAFKPDWNYRLQLGVNYVCHLLFVERALLDETGPLNTVYNGAQDHDLILRLSERVPPDRIHHVPEVLYHWRLTAASTASDVSAKPYAIDAGIACVSEHLKRMGRPAKVSSLIGITTYDVKWLYSNEPSVEIIIPFKDEITTTRRCVESILKHTKYRKYTITLVDNWSTSVEAAAFEREMKKLKRIRMLRVEEPFNYSRINNLAAQGSAAEFLLFMNNDLFVEGENWLRNTVNEALADDSVAIVGGKFVYPNRTIQHAGVVLGIGGVAGHAFTGVPEDELGYGGRIVFTQEYSAVTAAGMLMRTKVFREVGGFDEVGLTVAFNDIDLCLKARAAGYKVIWTPGFQAEHHESLSRGNDERPMQEARFFHEVQLMIERWGARLTHDPFYNKNFSFDRQPFFDLAPPTQAARRFGETEVAAEEA